MDNENQDRKTENAGCGIGTFNFLGFTHYRTRSLKGNMKLGRRTERKRFKKKLSEMKELVKSSVNGMTMKDLWEKVKVKVQGHYQYYGVSENSRQLQNYHHQVVRTLFKWLNRRSQRRSFNWKEFSH